MLAEKKLALAFNTLEIKNAENVAKLVTLPRCVIHGKHPVKNSKQHREGTAAGLSNNLTICQQTKYVEGETMMDSSEWGIFTVHSKLETTQPSINVELKINNAEVIMELDTGDFLTIMSESTLKQKLPNLKLQASTVMLKTYSGKQLKVLVQT